jgi:hypothetical protein
MYLLTGARFSQFGDAGFTTPHTKDGLGACVVPTNVLVRHLHCTRADLAEISRVVRRPMTAGDVRTVINTAATEAVRQLMNAATPLTNPRPSGAQGVMLRQHFVDAFGVQPEFVPTWRPAGQTWDRGAVVRERLRCAARILSNGSIRYRCWGPLSCRDFTRPWSPDHFARVHTGRLRICFGEAFWAAFRDGQTKELAATILHEALHIYFGTIRDTRERGTFGFAACYERYVQLMNRQPLSQYVKENCATGLPRGDFPLPPRDRAFAAATPLVPTPPGVKLCRVGAGSRQGLSGYGLGACEAGPANTMTNAQILAAIECELRRPFSDPKDPRLHLRRLRLRELFRAVTSSKAMELYDQLARPADPLAKLFHRLHPVTQEEMPAILARNFFKDYELRFNISTDRFAIDTNPDTKLDKVQRKKDVNDLVGDLTTGGGILWRRLKVRMDAALDNQVPTLSDLPVLAPSLRPAVERLSEAQLALFREWFPDGSGGIKLGKGQPFQRVFEQFTNGELRDPSVTDHPGFAEPGTGAFFLFAEFGFLAVDENIAKSDWERVLKTFVKVQEIFIHVYRENPKLTPPPVDAPLPTGDERRDVVSVGDEGGFHFVHFKQVGSLPTKGRGQSDHRRKRLLRDKYDAMTIVQLKAAARDNLIRAVRMK